MQDISSREAEPDELDIIGGGGLDPVPQAMVPSDHQLMAELSDVPPAQLLDGGSEDMDLVSSCPCVPVWRLYMGVC